MEKMIMFYEISIFISFMYIFGWVSCSFIWIVYFGNYDNMLTINNFYKDYWFMLLILNFFILMSNYFELKRLYKLKMNIRSMFI
jgi:hypothetical protein